MKNAYVKSTEFKHKMYIHFTDIKKTPKARTAPINNSKMIGLMLSKSIINDTLEITINSFKQKWKWKWKIFL